MVVDNISVDVVTACAANLVFSSSLLPDLS